MKPTFTGDMHASNINFGTRQNIKKKPKKIIVRSAGRAKFMPTKQTNDK